MLNTQTGLLLESIATLWSQVDNGHVGSSKPRIWEPFKPTRLDTCSYNSLNLDFTFKKSVQLQYKRVFIVDKNCSLIYDITNKCIPLQKADLTSQERLKLTLTYIIPKVLVGENLWTWRHTVNLTSPSYTNHSSPARVYRCPPRFQHTGSAGNILCTV